MLNFWNSIFFSDLLAPVFAKAAKLMNVSAQVCKEYCTSGMMLYGVKWLLILLLVVIAIVFIRLFGLLNTGNLGKYDPEKMEKIPNSPLKGKKVLFLGSSVTKGFAAYGKSFVDMIAERNDAICTKEAVSGTTLVEQNSVTGESYITRLKKVDKAQQFDAAVIQLSTNDATTKKPLGTIGDSTAIGSFDTQTVCGAIEWIIAYVKETWGCPVAFYTNPQYASPEYLAMVDALHQIAKKWDIQIIDLWNDREANTKENKKGTRMNDQIHPTKKGYQLWTPIFEAALANIIAGDKVPTRAAVEPAITPAAVAKQVSKKTGKKVILAIVAVILAFLIVLVSSTVQQLVTVTGLKNIGNSEQYDPESYSLKADSPIQGKHLLWLGSSVFQGFGSGKISPAEWIDAMDGTISTIEVKGGTFLASITGTIGAGYGDLDPSTSYTNRLLTHDTTTDPKVDLVVVQLSTNDSKGQCAVGEVVSGFDFEDFDIVTTAGSLEAITAYAKATWGARVLVITGTEFRDEMTLTGGQQASIYLEMIERCHEIDEKWGDDFTVLDLWHNDVMYEGIEMGDSLWRTYMSDAIHPTKRGYAEWWGPYIEQTLFDMLG